MIARVWHGYTKPEHADAYEALLNPELLPDVGKAEGYRGSYLLRRVAGDEVEFITIMLWDSIDAIQTIAGPDYETAKPSHRTAPRMALWARIKRRPKANSKSSAA